MKKLLVTLRHPGPVQAILSVLPYLESKFKITIIATDAGLTTLITRFSGIIDKIRLYYLHSDEWVIYNDNCDDWQNSDNAEFDSEDDEGLHVLKNKLTELVKYIKPNIVLRTTPATKLGIDEIVVDVCKNISLDIRCLCYQEDYGCGQYLDRVKNPIAVVDKSAQKILESLSIDAVVVGWLGQTLYQQFKTYSIARTEGRRKLGLYDSEIAILYCIGASSAFELEKEHFELIINRLKNVRIFYKNHPRNTDFQQKIIREIAKDKVVLLPETISYDETISFSDYIISIASAMNQDALQYQIESNEKKLRTISVYTKGKLSSRILLSTLGVIDLPQIQDGMGSIIINEEYVSDKELFYQQNQHEELLVEAKNRFGLSEEERLENLINYIEGV